MGIIWGEFPGGSAAIAKDIARKMISEYDRLTVDGQGDKIHRVGHQLYARGNRWRVELEASIVGIGLSLEPFPEAFTMIMKYALIPLCVRNVEGLHAQLARIRRRCTYMKAPAVAAALRLIANVARLGAFPDFFAFCVKHWRSNKLIDDTLMLRISPTNIKTLSRPEKTTRIYQASMADEHRDMNFERAQQSNFLALTAHCR